MLRSRTKPQSHRGGAPKLFVAGSFNSSGDPQLSKVAAHLQKRRVQGSMVTALMVQEHHYVKERLADAEHKYKCRGWSWRGAGAVCPTGKVGSNSAGVATMVRNHNQDGLEHYQVY